MLKKRIAAALTLREGIVVQSIGFRKYLPVGKPPIAVEFLNQWGVDEIILLDISATRNGVSIDPAVVKALAPKCFVPLAVGGGISTLEQVDVLIHTGADKVSVNHSALTNPELISDIAHKYGDQCVVAAGDVISTESGYRIYDYTSGRATEVRLEDWASEMQERGAGELLLNAVHRDGSYTGFDTEMVKAVTTRVHIPVIALGGAGNAAHFETLFRQTEAAAGCAGNFFHFTEHSVITTKALLQKAKLDIRTDTYADYAESTFDDNNRLRKKSDEVLDDMLYLKIEKEVI